MPWYHPLGETLCNYMQYMKVPLLGKTGHKQKYNYLQKVKIMLNVCSGFKYISIIQ